MIFALLASALAQRSVDFDTFKRNMDGEYQFLKYSDNCDLSFKSFSLPGFTYCGEGTILVNVSQVNGQARVSYSTGSFAGRTIPVDRPGLRPFEECRAGEFFSSSPAAPLSYVIRKEFGQKVSKVELVPKGSDTARPNDHVLYVDFEHSSFARKDVFKEDCQAQYVRIERSGPAPSVTPAEPSKPAETSKPSEPAKPADPVKPAEPTKPVVTSKPAETSKPDATKPAEPAATYGPGYVSSAKPTPTGATYGDIVSSAQVAYPVLAVIAAMFAL